MKCEGKGEEKVQQDKRQKVNLEGQEKKDKTETRNGKEKPIFMDIWKKRERGRNVRKGKEKWKMKGKLIKGE